MPTLNDLLQQPELLSRLSLSTTPYIPHAPTPKQRLFLSLPYEEAFYGGAAGGGKSDALLMGALQYVHIPRYSAIIFRRTLADLELPGALIDRSRTWLTNTDAKFSRNAWQFPSGARLQFGYLDTAQHKYRYQGAEFQYIAFDELTQFQEDDYLYLRSRLRRPRCPEHTAYTHFCAACREFHALSRVPLRMRAASNPGGIGHVWVKQRFDIRLDPTLTRRGNRALYIGTLRNSRPHVPAFIEDNPYLDQDSYIRSLQNLDPITREQLLAGDWGVSADGRFKRSWARSYHIQHENLRLGGDTSHHIFNVNQCSFFSVVDPAGTISEGPGDVERGADKRSYTVIATFCLTPDFNLLWWDLWRAQCEAPEIVDALQATYAKHKPSFFGIEYTAISMHLYRLLQRQGYPLKAFTPKGRDKLARSVDAANRMEEGRIYFPDHNPSWLDTVFTELFTWTGAKEQTDDIVDCLSYAANYVSEYALGAHGETSQNIVAELPFVV